MRKLVFGICLAVAVACLGGSRAAMAQSTAFTYQGVLESGGGSLTGTADLQFRLYDASSGGNLIGTQNAQPGISVDHGVFSVVLDFGTGAFLPGAARWLEIDVRSPAGSGSFTTLSPRQPVNPAPLAQGIAGIAITRAGALSLDQNQWDGYWSGSTTDRLDLTPAWESFTAAKTGALTSVELDGYGLVNGHSSPMTVKIHAGVGVSGPVIGTTVVNVPQGQSGGIPGASFPNVSVVAGSQYTIDPTGTVFLVKSNGDIAGAQPGPTPNNRFVFRTYVTPEGTIATKASKAAFADTAGTIGWSGLSSVPANVSGAFSPWVATTGGINYSDGNVGISNWAPQVPLHISGTTQIDTNVLLQFGGATENGDQIAFVRSAYAPGQSVLSLVLGYPFNGNDAFVIESQTGQFLFQFNTQSNGQALKIGGGSWGALSDARAKHDIEPLEGCLEKLLRLRGRTYFYNDPKAAGAGYGQHMGFVAQEVEPIFPDWIGESGGMKTINIKGFEALTVEALRELRSEKDREIQGLRAEQAVLREQNATKQREIEELKARLERLEARVK